MSSLWFEPYLTRALQTPFNDTLVHRAIAGPDGLKRDYAVSIERAAPAEDEACARLIGLHHLTGRENSGGRHLYLLVVDEQGRRVSGPPYLWAGWQWEGMRPGEQAGPVVLDKPANEPMGNIPIGSRQVISAWLKGLAPDGRLKTDIIRNVRTDFVPLEKEPGNSLYHHSYLAIFQLSSQAPALPPPKPDNPAQALEKILAEIEQRLQTARQLLAGLG